MWASTAFLTVSGNAVKLARMRSRGFTLIELLVVLSIVALLLTLAAPQFLPNLNKAKEAVLKQDLATMRDAIDKYYSDKGAYPDKLDALVTEKYLRKIPVDPITESASTWVMVSAEQSDSGGIADIRSGAPGKARDGSILSTW
jgi:general secretion pathway protein G